MTKAITLQLYTVLGLALLVAVASCAPEPPHNPTSAATRWGMVLGLRPVAPSDAIVPLRAALLAGGDHGDNDAHALTEFIVRADDGAILSFVQANDQALRKGDRVIIVHGEQTRLARSQ
jgi:hypothetical protein